MDRITEMYFEAVGDYEGFSGNDIEVEGKINRGRNECLDVSKGSERYILKHMFRNRFSREKDGYKILKGLRLDVPDAYFNEENRVLMVENLGEGYTDLRTLKREKDLDLSGLIDEEELLEQVSYRFIISDFDGYDDNFLVNDEGDVYAVDFEAAGKLGIESFEKSLDYLNYTVGTDLDIEKVYQTAIDTIDFPVENVKEVYREVGLSEERAESFSSYLRKFGDRSSYSFMSGEELWKVHLKG